MNILYCPKYHCELNAIECLWRNQKAFVRSRTHQSFDKMQQWTIGSINGEIVPFLAEIVHPT